MRVGMFSEGEGLVLNSTLVVTYDGEGGEKLMADVRSQCLDVEVCGGSGGAPTARPAKRNSQYLQVSIFFTTVGAAQGQQKQKKKTLSIVPAKRKQCKSP